MRYLIVVLIIGFCVTGYAESKLWRYVDKVTGEERGVCFSDVPIDNPDWTATQIPAAQQDYYVKLQDKQIKDKIKAEKNALKAKKKVIKDKLKSGTPLTSEEADILVGESD